MYWTTKSKKNPIVILAPLFFWARLQLLWACPSHPHCFGLWKFPTTVVVLCELCSFTDDLNWTLLSLEFKYVFFRSSIHLNLEGFRWSKIAPGRFLASQVSSEPKFSPNFFPRPSNRGVNFFQKSSWCSCPKHTPCCVFWKNMTSYLCDFIFLGVIPP